jgi:transcription initiation factor TFIIH subunit 4
LLPVTVQDQIRLWELERNRLKSQEGHFILKFPLDFFLNNRGTGYLYTGFASQADYEFVLNYARELGVVIWENSPKRCFFGTHSGHQNIKDFIERRALSAS